MIFIPEFPTVYLSQKPQWQRTDGFLFIFLFLNFHKSRTFRFILSLSISLYILRDAIYHFFSWKSVYLDWMLACVSDVQFRSHIQKVKSDKCPRFCAFHFISRSHESSSCPLALTFLATSYQYSQNTAHPARLLLSWAPEIISITCITKSVILCLNFLRYLSLCAK